MCGKDGLQCDADNRSTNIIEGTAVSASLLCLVHCLALPVILLSLPGVMRLFAQSEAFHFAALALVAPAALAAFWLGYRRHGAVWPGLFGLAGLACLIGALLPGLDENAGLWTTVSGSLLVIAGHAWNWRLRARAA